jgi:hypothetical protein
MTARARHAVPLRQNGTGGDAAAEERAERNFRFEVADLKFKIADLKCEIADLKIEIAEMAGGHGMPCPYEHQ